MDISLIIKIDHIKNSILSNLDYYDLISLSRVSTSMLKIVKNYKYNGKVKLCIDNSRYNPEDPDYEIDWIYNKESAIVYILFSIINETEYSGPIITNLKIDTLNDRIDCALKLMDTWRILNIDPNILLKKLSPNITKFSISTDDYVKEYFKMEDINFNNCKEFNWTYFRGYDSNKSGKFILSFPSIENIKFKSYRSRPILQLKNLPNLKLIKSLSVHFEYNFIESENYLNLSNCKNLEIYKYNSKNYNSDDMYGSNYSDNELLRSIAKYKWPIEKLKVSYFGWDVILKLIDCLSENCNDTWKELFISSFKNGYRFCKKKLIPIKKLTIDNITTGYDLNILDICPYLEELNIKTGDYYLSDELILKSSLLNLKIQIRGNQSTADKCKEELSKLFLNSEFTIIYNLD